MSGTSDNQSEGFLRAVVESMIDPFVIYRAVRDDAGNVTDFIVSEANEFTALLNRRELSSRVDYLISRTSRTGAGVALLFIDLDTLKPINDRLGHLVGDHVLREVASRIRSSVRTTDVVARYGGDEFVVILADTTRSRTHCGSARPSRTPRGSPSRWATGRCVSR